VTANMSLFSVKKLAAGFPEGAWRIAMPGGSQRNLVFALRRGADTAGFNPP
jgi:hypothetical protein